MHTQYTHINSAFTDYSSKLDCAFVKFSGVVQKHIPNPEYLLAMHGGEVLHCKRIGSCV